MERLTKSVPSLLKLWLVLLCNFSDTIANFFSLFRGVIFNHCFAITESLKQLFVSVFALTCFFEQLSWSILIEIIIYFLKIEMINKNFLIETIFNFQVYKWYFMQPPVTGWGGQEDKLRGHTAWLGIFPSLCTDCDHRQITKPHFLWENPISSIGCEDEIR